eukprot:scaffold142152_cov21-Tisochrysis_lutea.AAC.1
MLPSPLTLAVSACKGFDTLHLPAGYLVRVRTGFEIIFGLNKQPDAAITTDRAVCERAKKDGKTPQHSPLEASAAACLQGAVVLPTRQRGCNDCMQFLQPQPCLLLLAATALPTCGNPCTCAHAGGYRAGNRRALQGCNDLISSFAVQPCLLVIPAFVRLLEAALLKDSSLQGCNEKVAHSFAVTALSDYDSRVSSRVCRRLRCCC